MTDDLQEELALQRALVAEAQEMAAELSGKEMRDCEVMKQALYALEWWYGGEPQGQLIHDAIAALKERLGHESL
jgi:hypothetical protein